MGNAIGVRPLSKREKMSVFITTSSCTRSVFYHFTRLSTKLRNWRRKYVRKHLPTLVRCSDADSGAVGASKLLEVI